MPRNAALPQEAGGDNRMLSVNQAAAWLGVHRQTVWNWIRDGRLHLERFGPRTNRVSIAALKALAAAEKVAER